jgi:predicted GIY-YIG superfamily endonuclease
MSRAGVTNWACVGSYSSRFVIPSQARDLQLGGEKRSYVYIMASRSLNLYVGVTNSVYHRALQHKSGELEGFTKRYHINRWCITNRFSTSGVRLRGRSKSKGGREQRSSL